MRLSDLSKVLQLMEDCSQHALYCLPSHSCMLSCVWLFVTLWTIVHQAPLSMGFSRQEYWSRLPFPPLGDLPTPGIEPVSLSSSTMAGRFFTTSATWEAPLAKQNYNEVSSTPVRMAIIETSIYKTKMMENTWRKGLPWWLSGKESVCQCRSHRLDA